MKLTPDIPPSSTHLTRVCIMCLYWCQYEKFTININVFDDSFFNSKQYLSDRLTTFVIGLTKLRYRWKHYKECVSSTSSETTSTFLNILVCSLNRIRWKYNEVGVGWLCRYSGIAWEPIRKLSHTQLVREHSATIVSSRWTTVDWSWPEECSKCARVNLHLRRKKAQAGNEWSNLLPRILANEEKATTK